MGFPPPPDAPSLAVQDALELQAGFATGPIGPSLCGFQIPGFSFQLGFRLPIPTFAFPPSIFFALALQCDLANPLSLQFGAGGGRVASTIPEIDADFA